MEVTVNEMDEIIAREKRMAAMEFQLEAWADGVMEGIESTILADAAIATALEETIREQGEDAALALVDTLRERILCGEFTPNRSVQ
ncbi:hypothetical protein [Oricola sp.]|uniref:hypothetical protein n=1 Tax=Oricola sp. TaxID=1979950 RepID=UPI000C8D15B4|nr:hypothetical protein [Ahrensia sp.]MCK5750929.1 hypothetical protein [Oricola sp.]|tara:strand:- start:32 stop:289 length:258 start_codon:yes stop_codon:yes gene_type:complete